MLEYYLFGGGLRLGQIIIYSSLWLVIGFIVAGIFRNMLGPAKVRKLFGEGTKRGIFTGWLIGMLLPVCSLGAIPIVRELYRSKVKGGTIIAFGLTAPLFNPMSILYGLTLSDPIAILSFSLCALVIVGLLGILWDRFYPDTVEEFPDVKMPAPGIKRIAAVFYSAVRDATGSTLIYVLIGIACSVLTAVSFEKGHLQYGVEQDNVLAPVLVAAVALPIYSTPLLAMSQVGGMFQHGNSIGGAFALLILGAGANIGLLVWFNVTYGWKRSLAFLTLLFVTTIALAYAIDKPLTPKGITPAGHSHAFDVYTHPFNKSQSDIGRIWRTQLSEFWRVNELGGTWILGGFLLAGIVIRCCGTARVESWLYSESPAPERKYDFDVPGWVLGGTTVSGLIAASVVGCYFYYPSPEQLLPDLSTINTECVLSAKNQQWEAAEKWIPYADDLSRRLEVGVFLRNGSVDEFKTAKAKTYRDKLDKLKELVEQREGENIEAYAMDLSKSYQRLSRAFKDEAE
ncbi:permease [Mariniblastus fucicola]|nr:permease [Mariniblastus fucicola]